MVLRKASKDSILSSASIIDIAKEFDISLQMVSSGNFTHRCVCPHIDHKHGAEKTPSLYIDSVNNNFYCFGCGASSNVIDFYMICKNIDFSSALTDMSKYVKPGSEKSSKKVNGQSIYPVLLEMSSFFRDALLQNSEDREWIFKTMKRTDKHICDIDRLDVKSVKALFRRVKKIFKSRYGEL